MVTSERLAAPAVGARAGMGRFTWPSQISSRGHVVAIGMFDGLHMGHRRVLQRLRALGERHGLPTLVLTFDPHPRSVVGAQPAPHLLCTVADRLDLLASTGLVDACLVLPFDAARSQESVECFVADTLVGALGTRALAVGANFACGHRRRGTVACLKALGGEHGFDVHALPLRPAQGQGDPPVCSSTVIRRLIQAGDVEVAATLLGRPHVLAAQVEPAAGTGSAGEAMLPVTMCRPAAGGYRGAIGHPGRARDWTPGVLVVSADAGGEPCRVQWQCQAGPGSMPTGPVMLRFDARLRV